MLVDTEAFLCQALQWKPSQLPGPSVPFHASQILLVMPGTDSIVCCVIIMCQLSFTLSLVAGTIATV